MLSRFRPYIGPMLSRAGDWLGGELEKRGRAGTAEKVRRWGRLAAGSAWLCVKLSPSPTVEELHTLCQTLGDELELLGDPIAAVFHELTKEPELTAGAIWEKCGPAIEDAAGLRSADVIAVVWRALQPSKEPAK
jgi:hypothetical protein